MTPTESKEHRLRWMSPQAPYAAIAGVGLLRVLAGHDPAATLHWQAESDWRPPSLVLRSKLSLDDVAAAIESVPWPEIASLPWGGEPAQSLKRTLEEESKQSSDRFAAVKSWRFLAGLQEPTLTPGTVSQGSAGLVAAQQAIGSLLTDGALDNNGLPGRNRLLRGVKSDLSGVSKPPKLRPGEILAELQEGPAWRSGSSGLALGFAPEAQTFGGTTGPEPSKIGAYSGLLYRLCWQGIIAMPPFGSHRGRWWVVGGPLFSSGDTLSWPVWEAPLGTRALVVLFGLDAVHGDSPDPRVLRAHGITAVFRSTARAISTMVSVFGWGERVA